MKVIVFITLFLAVSYSQNTCECDDGEYFVAASDSTIAACKNFPTPTDIIDPHKYVENCSSYTFDGTNAICSTCDPEFYLKENACVSNNIENCEVQADDTNCTYCSKLFFLVEGSPDTCTSQVTDEVQDCKYHGSTTECIVCEDDFYLNQTDPTICVAKTEIENCEISIAEFDGTTICQKCKDTHPLVGCFSFDNCTAYLEDDQIGVYGCGECSANFFVNFYENECVAYPTGQNIIEQCIIYETNGNGNEFQCKTCSDDFFTNADNTKCIAFPSDIDECSVYISNGNDDNSKCGQCNTNFYANSDGSTCVAYANKSASIDNCLLYETNGIDDESQCQKCADNFFITNDNSQCVPYPTDENAIITGCSIYITNGNAENFICGVCEDNKWLLADGTGCEDKTINEFCAEFIWEADAESCTICIENSYENSDGNCAVCPVLNKDKITNNNDGSDDDDDNDENDDEDEQEQKDDDENQNDDDKEEEKDQNDSAFAMSFYLGIFGLAFIAIV